LISEVHYLTGLVLKVTEIIEILRAEEQYSHLVFMVDGSQSVGNLLTPFNELSKHLRGEDFYYFSAHKWLLSPNTCGVLISRKNADRYTVRPYDLFGSELPTSTIDPGVIFGIKSSLEFLIEEVHLIKFHDISASLRSYFIKELGEKFDVIESASQEMNRSNFVAVRPRAGHKWRDASVKKFWEKIRSDGVDLTLDKLDESDPSRWWLRISFPYFLQLHLLNQLIKHLESRVICVN
jgi:selenocysteine lyase/cysteine desulfurase